MNRTTLGLILVVLGIAIAVISGVAHLIGLSFTASGAEEDTFGWRQVVGVAVGVAVAIAGIALARLARDEQGGGTGAGADEARGR